MPFLRNTLSLVVISTLMITQSFSQYLRPKKFILDTPHSTSALPPSNSVDHIVVDNSTIWIGTSKGIAKSIDAGKTWQSFRSDPEFSNDGIFALATNNDTVWASTGFEKEVVDGSVQTGSGYTFSIDSGKNWKHFPQTLDNPRDSIFIPPYGINDSVWFLPVVVPEQNVTFDISLSAGKVWIASWASGLRWSRTDTVRWNRVLLPFDNQNSIRPSDTLWSYATNGSRIFRRFDPRHNNNLLAFSVFADKETIWCGTAGGVNKSTDGGQSWIKFNHQNQVSSILGNWVIAIKAQSFQGKQRIWTTNWKADDQTEQFGVSYTENGGKTWKNLLHGIKAYDFAFQDSIAYIATIDGIYRTDDGGLSFTSFSYMSDATTRQVISLPNVYSAGVLGNVVFVGTGDGMASTSDDGINPFGTTWNIYRTYQPLGTATTTYSFPNPFSPAFGPVRIHYGAKTLTTGAPSRMVSVDIFDFAMNRIRTLLHSATRSANIEYDEIWDGKSDDGKNVANGVYFYRLKVDSDEPIFGKILVLQ